MYDIIIVGAGTAGLTAAIYGARAGKSILVLEAASYGGQIIVSREVENYPGISKISGMELAMNLYKQAQSFGAVIESTEVIGLKMKNNTWTVLGKTKEYEAKAVILATGAKHRELGFESESRLVGAGVSYCATCDGMFYRGMDVAVIGGGNTALMDALFLADICKSVRLVHRRDEFRGERNYVERLKKCNNVSYLLHSEIVALDGKEHLESMTVRNKENGLETKIPVDGVFVAIGQSADNERFAEFVELDEQGYIVAGEDTLTSHKGIFAAGDGRTKSVRQLVTAAADGAAAALAACEYLNR